MRMSMKTQRLTKVHFYEPLKENIEELISNFSNIPEDRKVILKLLTSFIESGLKSRRKAELVFICTHNSRRSHIAQIWGQTAAAYYDINDVLCYSGGTEATAFNPRAVQAMEKIGFKIFKNPGEGIAIHDVSFSKDASPIKVFSKKYDSETNPKKGFAAIMTCSHADENCPVISGMEKRISLPYDDPKDFDDTLHEGEKYFERVKEIGSEILWAFSQVKAD